MGLFAKLAGVGTFFVAAAVPLAGLELIATELAARASTAQVHDFLPPLVSLPPQLLDQLSLGHKALYDDFVTLWAVQVITDEAAVNYSADDWLAALRRMAVHEIRLESFYTFGCMVAHARMNRADICIELTAFGLKAFPTSWRIPLTQAYAYQVFFQDLDKAAVFYQMAGAQPGAPPYVAEAGRKAATKEGLASALDEIRSQILDAAGGADLRHLTERLHLMNQSDGVEEGKHQ